MTPPRSFFVLTLLGCLLALLAGAAYQLTVAEAATCDQSSTKKCDPTDTTPPTVRLTSPDRHAPGQYTSIQRVVEITATATDNQDIANVKFYAGSIPARNRHRSAVRGPFRHEGLAGLADVVREGRRHGHDREHVRGPPLRAGRPHGVDPDAESRADAEPRADDARTAQLAAVDTDARHDGAERQAHQPRLPRARPLLAHRRRDHGRSRGSRRRGCPPCRLLRRLDRTRLRHERALARVLRHVRLAARPGLVREGHRARRRREQVGSHPVRAGRARNVESDAGDPGDFDDPCRTADDADSGHGADDPRLARP